MLWVSFFYLANGSQEGEVMISKTTELVPQKYKQTCLLRQ